jgi:hypothetical protein
MAEPAECRQHPEGCHQAGRAKNILRMLNAQTRHALVSSRPAPVAAVSYSLPRSASSDASLWYQAASRSWGGGGGAQTGGDARLGKTAWLATIRASQRWSICV